jgi:pilus assembly protein FimV
VESEAGSLLDFGAEPAAPGDSTADGPLARKLELAEEFRQIGDLEGARDLLDEVVSKADGALKAKALGMLEKLG